MFICVKDEKKSDFSLGGGHFCIVGEKNFGGLQSETDGQNKQKKRGQNGDFQG